MAQGSCLCGKVGYQLLLLPNKGPLDIVHCHCTRCRKAHGAAFSSVAAVPLECFQLSGAEHLQYFESSPGKRRFFCKHCGTQIYAKRDNVEHIVLRLGSLDVSPSMREEKHIWRSQAADWYHLDTDLPECAEFK